MWDFRAREGFVISIVLEIQNVANDIIYYGDGVDQFSIDNNFCSRWKIFNNTFWSANFTSISSSVKLIFTSAGSKTGHGFLIDLKAIRHEGRQIHKAGGYYFQALWRSFQYFILFYIIYLATNITLNKTIILYRFWWVQIKIALLTCNQNIENVCLQSIFQGCMEGVSRKPVDWKWPPLWK